MCGKRWSMSSEAAIILLVEMFTRRIQNVTKLFESIIDYLPAL